MHSLRKFLSWSFAFTALVCLQLAFSLSLRTIHEQHRFRLLLLLTPSMMIAFAVIFGMAWWAVFKRKSSARGWGIAASLINVQVSLVPMIIPPRSMWNVFLPLLGLGIAGLVAFGRKFEHSDYSAGTQESHSIPGDGTSDLVNKSAPLLIFGAGLAGYYWWLGWLTSRGVPSTQSSWYRGIAIMLVILVISALHELGHAATGMALGMKLRGFIVGPFQWCVREGKWKFDFKLKQILSGDGKTGVVPSNAKFSRRAHLCMTAAGIVVNVATGIVALWIASVADAESPVQAGGLLPLFGIWSLVLGAMNLVPFQTGDSYSDGSQIYQLLSNGPLADLQRAFSVAGSSLVTPLRPRNYDIDIILRAGRTISQGTPGVLLRLLAYNHFLDQDRIPQAAQALGEAELICNQRVSGIPVELLTALVFGSAYVSRDASTARRWWTQMEAKKPTHFNVDYWLAATALHWIEGNLKEANESWEKANALAQRLPDAGAYQFDRHCCSLLRDALDECHTAG